MNLFLTWFIGSQLYLVQNLATLQLRVYDKNRLILETPMVVGKNEITEDNKNYRSVLGSFEIKEWKKFYVDQKEKYKPWNDEPLVSKGSARAAWGSQGAFGVYAAILDGPQTWYQHIHGTVGYPSEEDKFIKHTTTKDGEVHRIASKGCSRLANDAVMFLRNYLPPGTPVFKIYAKEKNEGWHLIKSLEWKYVLYEGEDLKEDYPLNARYKSKLKDKKVKILDKGVFKLKTYPTVFKVADPSSRGKDHATNPYDIPLNELSTFDVARGKVEKNYRPPAGLHSNKAKFPDWFFLD